MTVNRAWRGRRYKSSEYKLYVIGAGLLLPKSIEIPDGPLSVYYEFGVSYSGADYDNPIKPFQDILQDKYGFNDSRIMEAHIKKVVVKKGEEYIKFSITQVKEL